MRVMIKFTFPVDSGNEAVRSGKMGKVFERLLGELKPEAAYFFPADGERAGLVVINMTDASEVVQVAERFFLGLNAKIEMTPVMAAEDLQKGLSGLESIIKAYAG